MDLDDVLTLPNKNDEALLRLLLLLLLLMVAPLMLLLLLPMLLNPSAAGMTLCLHARLVDGINASTPCPDSPSSPPATMTPRRSKLIVGVYMMSPFQAVNASISYLSQPKDQMGRIYTEREL